MSVDNEVALDLSCRLRARVDFSIFRNEGLSWLEKIIRDTKMGRGAVRRHFSGRRDECG